MRTVSCGCCTDGCVCWMHRRTTPASGHPRDLPKCAYHAEHGHPRVTSPIEFPASDVDVLVGAGMPI